jgi:hypothetical protein
MNNRYDEIRKLLKTSKELLSKKSSINELNEIRSKYGILNEDDSVTKKINVAKSIEQGMTDDDEDIKNEDEKSQGYRILNGLMYVVGKTDTELILTEDEKTAFKETMDEFFNEVSDAVDFDELILYPKKVEWSGHLNTLGVKFKFITNDSAYFLFESEKDDEVQITPMLKLDENFKEITDKVMVYFGKFESKWNQIISERKKTKIPIERKPLGGKNFEGGYETFKT